MTTGKKYNKDKLFVKISHAAASGVVGATEYEVFGEINLRAVSTFTTSGTLTIQGRIRYSSSWESIGTLAADGDSDSFDISSYDYIRFNFTVEAGSTGDIAASGFFKGSTSAGGATNSFTIIQPDAGTAPTADSSTDTLTITSSDSSLTITGNETTDTIDITGAGDVSGPSSSVDNAIVRFNSTTGKLLQDYTSNAPTIGDNGTANFGDGTYTNCQRIGSGSTCSNIKATVIGVNSAAGHTATGLGYSTVASGQYSVASGAECTVSGQWSQSLGAFNIITHDKSIIIGGNASSRAANEILIGAGSTTFTSVVMGQGATSAAPSALSIGRTDGAGTNVSGADTTYKASAGTGTGVGGHLIFQTAAAGASSATLNTLVTQLELTDDGNVIMANLPTSAAGLPSGALWNNSNVVNIV